MGGTPFGTPKGVLHLQDATLFLAFVQGPLSCEARHALRSTEGRATQKFDPMNSSVSLSNGEEERVRSAQYGNEGAPG